MSDSLSKLEQQSSPASSYFIIARCCSELEPRGHDHDELRYDHSRELDGISSGVGYKCLLCEAGCAWWRLAAILGAACGCCGDHHLCCRAPWPRHWLSSSSVLLSPTLCTNAYPWLDWAFPYRNRHQLCNLGACEPWA